MTVIVDYGMGNLGSVRNMLKKVGVDAVVTSDAQRIADAERMILPGVGAFDAAMQRIADLGLRDALDHVALTARRPVLGICLGMQLLLEDSEEGQLPGLGWIPGHVIGFKGRIDTGLKIPHMGWNEVRVAQPQAVTAGFEAGYRFYFVHSYFAKVTDPLHAMLHCDYGVAFDAGVCRDNIFGVQFHPEKSHRFGMHLLRNFANL